MKRQKISGQKAAAASAASNVVAKTVAVPAKSKPKPAAADAASAASSKAPAASAASAASSKAPAASAASAASSKAPAASSARKAPLPARKPMASAANTATTATAAQPLPPPPPPFKPDKEEKRGRGPPSRGAATTAVAAVAETAANHIHPVALAQPAANGANDIKYDDPEMVQLDARLAMLAYNIPDSLFRRCTLDEFQAVRQQLKERTLGVEQLLTNLFYVPRSAIAKEDLLTPPLAFRVLTDVNTSGPFFAGPTDFADIQSQWLEMKKDPHKKGGKKKETEFCITGVIDSCGRTFWMSRNDYNLCWETTLLEAEAKVNPTDDSLELQVALPSGLKYDINKQPHTLPNGEKVMLNFIRPTNIEQRKQMAVEQLKKKGIASVYTGGQS